MLHAVLGLAVPALTSHVAAAQPPPPAAAPAPAAAPHGKHCLNEGRSKVLLGHTLAAQINPLGAEHQLVLSVCKPLIRAPGILYDLSNVEVGVGNYLSPAYVHQSAFLGVTPLSILQLKAEVAGVFVWTIPIDGAGYYPFPSYDADYSEDTRPKDIAQTARGYVLSFSGTLRGRIGPEGGVALLASNTLLAERWSLGDGPYYHNLRRDILLAETDWVLKNTGVVLVEIPISETWLARIGAVDDTVVAPESGRTTNLVAGLATLLFRRPGAGLREIQPFLRLGGYTHHASSTGFRTGEINAMLGVDGMYELEVIDD